MPSPESSKLSLVDDIPFSAAPKKKKVSEKPKVEDILKKSIQLNKQNQKEKAAEALFQAELHPVPHK